MPINISIPSIVCAFCAESISNILQANPQLKIKKFEVKVFLQELIVEFDTQDPKEQEVLRKMLLEALRDGGFTVINPQNHWLLGGIGLVAGIAMLVIMLTGVALPFSALIALGGVSTIITLWLGKTSFQQAWLKWKKNPDMPNKRREVTMDTLFSISTISVLLVSLASFAFHFLPMMFDAGLLIFGFRHIGLGIRQLMRNHLDFKKKFQDTAPKTVQVYDEIKKVVGFKNTQSVLPGELVLVEPGEMIPLDGESLNDNGLINELLVTGQDIPRPISANETLLAGMRIPIDGTRLLLRVKNTHADSYLSSLDKQLTELSDKKAPIQEYADKVLRYFIPTILSLAIISGVVVGIFFPPALAIQCAVSVLVAACPCTLGLVVPLSLGVGMRKAKQYGIQAFKDPSMLQCADSIDTVVFDLNGTLTKGNPEVVRAGLFQGADIPFDEVCSITSSLESQSSHAYAHAICRHIKKVVPNVPQPPMSSAMSTIIFGGVQASMDNHSYSIGNEYMMRHLGIDITRFKSSLRLKDAERPIFFAKDNQIVAYFILSDALRDDAKATIQALQSMRKKVLICTGECRATAAYYASMLGIDINDIYAECKPNEKEKIINELKTIGPRKGKNVAMVGDAANDSLAIAASDFGIAIKSKSTNDLVEQQAGVVLQNSNLQPVLNAFVIARQTMRNIKQNLFFSLGYNVCSIVCTGGLLVALGFALNPGIGVALMILQTVLILLNVYRLQKQTVKRGVSQILDNNMAPIKQLSRISSAQNRLQAEMLLQPETEHASDEADERLISPLSENRNLNYFQLNNTDDPLCSSPPVF